MPINISKTAPNAFQDLMPGDFFWSNGAGLVGRLIRRGTTSPYAHCGIIVAVTETHLVCHEAFGKSLRGPGLFVTKRKLGGTEFAAVSRPWRTVEERQAILDESWEMVKDNLRYDWATIGLIALATVLPHRWIPMKDPDFGAIICSGHVAECLMAARRNDYTTYMASLPWFAWPGSLHAGMNQMMWNDQRNEAK